MVENSVTKPNLNNINHIAIAIPYLEKAVKIFSNAFKNEISPIKILKQHGVRIAWIKLSNCKIELMEPYGANSPLISFLEKHPKGGIHHICSEVESLKSSIEHLTSQSINTSEIKKGADDSKISFIKPKDFFGTLLELLENN